MASKVGCKIAAAARLDLRRKDSGSIKTTNNMKTRTNLLFSLGFLAPGLLGFAVVGNAFGAEVVFVTSTTSNCVSSADCGSGANPDVNPNTGYYIYNDNGMGAFTSARVTTVPDKPNTPGARYFSNSFSNSIPDIYGGVTIHPALGTPGGIYKLYHIFSSTANNVSTSIILGVTNSSGCTLSFTQTDKFQRQYGQPAPQAWQFLGYLTNDAGSANPMITFYYLDGVVSAGAQQRLLIDTFKFLYYDPCTDVDPVTISGPLGTNLNLVSVFGATNASAVTVYQDSGSGFVPIGSLTAGVVDGYNAVPVTGLVKGARVAATQTVNGQEGCMPTSGLVVGGGPNPLLRVVLSIREAPNATGPIGANGSAYTTNSGRIHFLGASALCPGPGPAGGLLVYPSNDWQTVTFQRGPDYQNPIDPSVIWNSSISGQAGTVNDLQGDWGTLEAIGLALEDTSDTGPYQIYIDNILNGDPPQVVEDFEDGPANMGDYTFRAPTFSGSTSGNILSFPNDAVLDNRVADSGTKSLRVAFQWASLSTNKWVRLTTYQTPAGHRNPLINLNDPISFRILIQPPGATTPVPPPASSISARSVDGQVVLDWVGGHRLQTSVDASGAYTNVPQVIVWPDINTFLAPFTNTFTEPTRFFRLAD